MIRAHLNEYRLGWSVGDFAPSILTTKEFEVAVKSFSKGDTEPIHHQRHATEITLVTSGECCLAGELLFAGDMLRLDPFESGGFEAITNCTLVVVKAPSLPNDKVLDDAGL